jgi:uncharacterized membrane protein YedE/YeeE
MSALFHVLLGVAFGWVLSRSGAADYDHIQAMFRFQSFQLYGILGVAVAITAPGLWLLKRRARTLLGSPLQVSSKPFHRGNLLGGALFGIGWSVTGMCPGPIVVNLGEGKLYAIAALLGALLGSSLFALSYPRLQSHLRLPKLESGAGDG